MFTFLSPSWRPLFKRIDISHSLHIQRYLGLHYGCAHNACQHANSSCLKQVVAKNASFGLFSLSPGSSVTYALGWNSSFPLILESICGELSQSLLASVSITPSQIVWGSLGPKASTAVAKFYVLLGVGSMVVNYYAILSIRGASCSSFCRMLLMRSLLSVSECHA
jgi:hypothetical protein